MMGSAFLAVAAAGGATLMSIFTVVYAWLTTRREAQAARQAKAELAKALTSPGSILVEALQVMTRNSAGEEMSLTVPADDSESMRLIRELLEEYARRAGMDHSNQMAVEGKFRFIYPEESQSTVAEEGGSSPAATP